MHANTNYCVINKSKENHRNDTCKQFQMIKINEKKKKVKETYLFVI